MIMMIITFHRNSLKMFLKTCFGTLFVFLTTVKAAPKPTPTGQVSPSSSPPGNCAKLIKLFSSVRNIIEKDGYVTIKLLRESIATLLENL